MQVEQRRPGKLLINKAKYVPPPTDNPRVGGSVPTLATIVLNELRDVLPVQSKFFVCELMIEFTAGSLVQPATNVEEDFDSAPWTETIMSAPCRILRPFGRAL
jgi:hypothetical protein